MSKEVVVVVDDVAVTVICKCSFIASALAVAIDPHATHY